MLLIWHGILLSDFHHTLNFLERGFFFFFFDDFTHVADDESRHFAWCSQRLAELGFSYGDMLAHNLLWKECEKSSHNVAAHLAAVPLV
ncbi:unnamed protein product [Camellia sinensis]